MKKTRKEQTAVTKFAFEPWAVTEEGFSAAALPENESVFALGNGFIAV